MKNIINSILFISVIYQINFALCQICDTIVKDIEFGQTIYDFEKQKSKILTERNFICEETEPFSIIFRQNGQLYRNMSEIFSNNEVLLRGTQKILNEYYAEYQNANRPSRKHLNSYLKQAADCIPEAMRCPTELRNLSCDPNEKYRMFDGSCNNLEKPYQGAALTQYSRLNETAVFYDDNVMEIRKSVSGEDLISPRILIDKLLLEHYNTDGGIIDYPNMAWIFFGQLLTHDIAGSLNNMHGKAKQSTDPPIRCCSRDYKAILPQSELHPGCLPFPISSDDKFHRHSKLRCHNYIRSKATLPNDCGLKAAQQVNRVSHYIDLSVIYGNSMEESEELRTQEDGKLLTSEGDLLPKGPGCVKSDCYFTGDFRAVQSPSLAILHLVFVRLHNIIAGNIKERSADWEDEKIFQEARRINIATYQNIIYNNYLPVLLSEKYDDNAKYDSSTDGSAMNDFITGAFRQLHWYIPESLRFFEMNHTGSMPLGELLLDDTDYVKNNFSAFFQNLMLQPINVGKIQDEIVNRLFNQTDLLSTDIQRGRDHGLAPYWKYRELCGFNPVRFFGQLFPSISVKDQLALMKFFKSSRDLDLYIGGGLELKARNQLVGPTFKCLTKIQFDRLKNGDRFFYTHSGFDHSFEPRVIDAIRNVSLAAVLCSTTNAEFVPANAFLIPSAQNEFIDCSSIMIENFITKLKME